MFRSGFCTAEAAYLLEYYSLVDAGKMNYIATSAYKQITGQDVTLLPDFFKTCASPPLPLTPWAGSQVDS